MLSGKGFLFCSFRVDISLSDLLFCPFTSVFFKAILSEQTVTSYPISHKCYIDLFHIGCFCNFCKASWSLTVATSIPASRIILWLLIANVRFSDFKVISPNLFFQFQHHTLLFNPNVVWTNLFLAGFFPNFYGSMTLSLFLLYAFSLSLKSFHVPYVL